jgi:hypothetical protein
MQPTGAKEVLGILNNISAGNGRAYPFMTSFSIMEANALLLVSTDLFFPLSL